MTPKTVRFERTENGGGVGQQQHIYRCGHPVRMGRKSYRTTPANSSGHVCVCVFWQDRTHGYCDRLKHFFFYYFSHAVGCSARIHVSGFRHAVHGAHGPSSSDNGHGPVILISIYYHDNNHVVVATAAAVSAGTSRAAVFNPFCILLPVRARTHTQPYSFCAAKTSAFASKRPFVCGDEIKIIIE